LIYSEKDLVGFFKYHSISKRKTIELNEMKKIYDNFPLQNIKDSTFQKENTLKMFLKTKTLNCSSSNSISVVLFPEEYKQTCEYLSNILEHILPDFPDIPNYINTYSFEVTDTLSPSTKYSSIILENVFYFNKRWYDCQKNPISVDLLDKDCEYRYFKKEPDALDISNIENYVSIEEEVLYLDYIYMFYNFGEFWDVLKRLISFKRILPLFYLKKTDVKDINYYFNVLGFYPKYEVSKSILYRFVKINISLMERSFRGRIDVIDAHIFNSIFNKEAVADNSYFLYLSRGKFKRLLLNEDYIISELKKSYPLIVIDGSEDRETLIYYFTNAKLIIGPHGSLMKNMIWCKKTPVFIELLPTTRHTCFVDNSLRIGFKTFFFILECDEMERMILSELQAMSIVKLFELITNA